MDPASAKLIGAGLAAIGTGAAAIGVGNLFGQFLQGALRNPSAADGQKPVCQNGGQFGCRPPGRLGDRAPADLP